MKTMHSNPSPEHQDDLLSEYTFDYTKAKPNRFAVQNSQSPATVVVLDEDIAQIFATSEAVNKALRHLIEAMPS
jgi:phosphopantetheinyl transferase (holo-ACP synthase)